MIILINKHSDLFSSKLNKEKQGLILIQIYFKFWKDNFYESFSTFIFIYLFYQVWYTKEIYITKKPEIYLAFVNFYLDTVKRHFYKLNVDDQTISEIISLSGDYFNSMK